jgi:hypothetical protein
MEPEAAEAVGAAASALPGGEFHRTLLITFYDPVAWMLSQQIPKGLP